MERRYRECDNQSHITLECDTAIQPIRTQESGHVIKVNNIDQSCVFWHFSTRNFCKDMINIGPTSKAALYLVSTLVSGYVSAWYSGWYSTSYSLLSWSHIYYWFQLTDHNQYFELFCTVRIGIKYYPCKCLFLTTRVVRCSRKGMAGTQTGWGGLVGVERVNSWSGEGVGSW